MKNFPKSDNWSVMISLCHNGLLISLCDELSNVRRIEVVEEDYIKSYNEKSMETRILSQFAYAAELEAEETPETALDAVTSSSPGTGANFTVAD
jgi:hypothetical protein